MVLFKFGWVTHFFARANPKENLVYISLALLMMNVNPLLYDLYKELNPSNEHII